MIVGIGTDIISIERIQQALENPKFPARVLTDLEQAHGDHSEYVAGRWAAKEAIYKAVGRGITWQSLAILNDAEGKPIIAWQVPSPLKPGEVLHLSISHERGYASAIAILERT